jgi:1-acyl-sn-glycerol-3-phosphate acyltransferase
MSKIRAAFRMIIFLSMSLSLYAGWFIGSLVIPNKPFWRQIVFRAWARAFLAISSMTVEVIGKPPRPPFLLAANHLSYVDVAAFRAVVDAVFVAKRDTRVWPLAGRIIDDMGTVFIDRRNRRDIPRAGGAIIDRIDGGEGVIIFPEGTSTNGDDVLPFNSSLLEFAARKKLPVHFASITYRTPAGEAPASDAVCWWDDTVFIEHLWRLFALKEFTAVINFGETPLTLTDRKELAHELRERIRERFIPVV